MKKIKVFLALLIFFIIILISNNVQAINSIEERNVFNNNLIILSVILIIYWIFLLFKYERDKKYDIASNDEEMFNKYNPLIAGCIQGNRNVVARDIIAVILDLVNKKYLIIETIQDKKDNYKYFLKINKKSNYKLDEIEQYITDWTFFKYERNKTEKEGLNLIDRLKEMTNEYVANRKFIKLDKITTEHLNKLGANQVKVPKIIRIFNIYIFIFAVGLALYNISKGMNIDFLNLIIDLTYYSLSLFVLFIYIIAIIIRFLKKIINKIVVKISEQKIVFTSVCIIVFFVITMIISAILIYNKYLLTGELLIGIAALIMFTDNLMTKHDPIMAEDYSRLNALKNKIEKYSMIDDKEIKEIVLWEKYLTYAISFGIADKIKWKGKIMLGEDWTMHILYYDMFYDDYNIFDKKNMDKLFENIIEKNKKDMER